MLFLNTCCKFESDLVSDRLEYCHKSVEVLGPNNSVIDLAYWCCENMKRYKLFGGPKKRIIPVCNTGAYGANAACQKQIKCLHLAASQPVFWGLFRGVSANQDSQPLRCQLWPEAIGLCTRPMVYTWWTHYKIKEGQKLFYVDNDLPKVQKPNPSIQTVSVPNWCPSLCSPFWWEYNQMYECRSCL